MPANTVYDIFQFAHVLGTKVTDKSKRVLAQIGSVFGGGQQDSDNVEWLQHAGVVSLPSSAVAGKEAASALVIRLGNREIAIGCFDERGQALKGGLLPGETCIYAAGSDGAAQARILLKDDGSINMYTREGNTEGGAGMLVQLDAGNDTIRLLNSTGNGIIIDPDGVKITSGGSGSSLTLNSSGTCSLVATGQCQVDGATVLLGSIAAPVVNAVCVGPAGLVAVASSKVLCAVV